MDSVYNEGPNGNKNYRLSEWSKITNRLGNDDWAEGRGFIYPRIYTHLVSKFLRAIKKDKIAFDYAHIEAYPNWALDGPKLYFMSKIYWNPEANPDSLLTLFCKDMFGKASRHMKSYFNILEELNTSMNNDPKRERRIGAYTTQLLLNDNELALLGSARSEINLAITTATTEQEKARISFFSDGFKISEALFSLYNKKDSRSQKGEELKKYLSQNISGNQMMLNMATDKDFIATMDQLIDQIITKTN